MKKSNWKRLKLLALLAALLLVVSGCLIKPDKTVDEEDPNPANILPFETATPSPSPAPTSEGGQSGWEGGDAATATSAIVIVTNQPITPAPTIAIITPSPAPVRTAAPTIKATAAPTDNGTLRSGSSGSEVKKLQQRLKDLGYYKGSVDGAFGSGTETALKAFQKANGLSADGIAGSKTLSTLNSSSAKSNTSNSAYATSRPAPVSYTPSTFSKFTGYLQLGSSGTNVRNLQQRLKDLGYFNGTVNGNFGADTEAALIAFQERNGQWADGVAGEDTLTALYSNSALAHKKNEATQTNVTLAYRTLRPGMSGSDVLQLQQRLSDLYYYDSKVDGTYSTTTELAVKVFQQRNGLSVDGVAGTSTQQRIYSSSALSAPTAQPTATAYKATGAMQAGSTGEEVYRLQERLFDLGYYTGRIDGIYSTEVETAVRAYQTQNGLTADGKAGNTTQTSIYGASAKAKSGADNTLFTLRAGDTGERVRALQGILSNYGYYTGEITGTYSEATVTAVQQFQAQNDLYVDGIAGPATQQLLYYDTPAQALTTISAMSATSMTIPETSTANYLTLKQGMSGPDVMVLQQLLSDAGYYFSNIDGNFGATTFVAVQSFQAANELTADGIAGASTLELLYKTTESTIDADDSDWEGAGLVSTVRTTMKLGDEGQDVFDLQQRLQVLGYYIDGLTGTYDAATEAAVKEFQQQNGLTADGASGPATITSMYAAGVVPQNGILPDASSLVTVDNRTRELEEQASAGAIQGSLAGGGVAASLNGKIYSASGKGGALTLQSGSTETTLHDGPARFIHASDKGITFVSGGKILRIPPSGGKAETLAEAKSVTKLVMAGDTMCYLEGDSLFKATTQQGASLVSDHVYDFSIDIYQRTAYTASSEGIKEVPLNGNSEQLICSTPANQVQLCDGAIIFRSGGAIYRVTDGISVLLAEADASWMGIYRDKIYYITAGTLYRCDTNGQAHEQFYAHETAEVSFVAGKVYITGVEGGPITQVLPVD